MLMKIMPKAVGLTCSVAKITYMFYDDIVKCKYSIFKCKFIFI